MPLHLCTTLVSMHVLTTWGSDLSLKESQAVVTEATSCQNTTGAVFTNASCLDTPSPSPWVTGYQGICSLVLWSWEGEFRLQRTAVASASSTLLGSGS